MCGRYSFTSPGSERIVERFNIDSGVPFDMNHDSTCARSVIPVIISREGETLRGFKWGLVPYWAKIHHPQSNHQRANRDVITTFSIEGALERRRCLIPADGDPQSMA